MKFGKTLAVSAAALAIGIATPSFAQVTEGGNGSADNNQTTVVDDVLSNNGNDINSNNDDNGNNRDNEANGNGNNRDNEANDNGNNRGNDQSDDDGIDDSLNGSLNGNDASDDDGNGSFNGNGSGNSDDDSLAVAISLSAQDNDNNGNNRDNNNTTVVAVQDLTAVNANLGMEEVVDMDTAQEGHRLRTGDNSANNNAYAAFAGVMSQSWNTGLNANVQAATNIAARGSVNFGSAPQ